MFYSRPDIKPLGIDLLDLPQPSGSHHLIGKTQDGKELDIRYRSGYLQVHIDEYDEHSDDNLKRKCLIKRQVFPWYYQGEPNPVQFCDILGITINGQKIFSPKGTYAAEPEVDLSGHTTYWISKHNCMPNNDIENFIDIVSQTFPEADLFQYRRCGKLLKLRRVPFVTESDEFCRLGFCLDKTKIEGAYENQTWTEFAGLFSFYVDFSFSHLPFFKQKSYLDLKKQLREKHIEARFLVNQRMLAVKCKFETDNKDALELTNKLVVVINEYFCTGVNQIDLNTGNVMEKNVSDEYAQISFSKELRDWCLKEADNYLSVRSPYRDELDADNTIYYIGFRPNPSEN